VRIDRKSRTSYDDRYRDCLPDCVDNGFVPVDETLLAIEIDIIDIPEGKADVIGIEIEQKRPEGFQRIQVKIKDPDLVIRQTVVKVGNQIRYSEGIHRIGIGIPVG
jgi:hypothetical protein